MYPEPEHTHATTQLCASQQAGQGVEGLALARRSAVVQKGTISPAESSSSTVLLTVSLRTNTSGVFLRSSLPSWLLSMVSALGLGVAAAAAEGSMPTASAQSSRQCRTLSSVLGSLR